MTSGVTVLSMFRQANKCARSACTYLNNSLKLAGKEK